MQDNRGLLSYDTLVHAVAGATGSVVGMSTFYPLDTVRCRLQLGDPSENGVQSNGGVHSNGHANGTVHSNGNGIGVVHINGTSHSNGASHSNGITHSNGNGYTNGKPQSNGIAYIGNVGNGPVKTVSVKYQGRMGASTWRMLRVIFEREGISGLYRGVVPVLQSLCASNFVYFYTFHGLRSAWGGRALARGGQSAGRDLLLGAVAGAINVLVTTPLWVVNTRLKMSGTPYSSLMGGLRHVAHEEGVQGLWAGTGPSLLLVANPALQFMLYEAMKRRLGRNMSAITSLLVGAVAKATATILTYPLQVAQAHLRHRGTHALGKGSALALLVNLVKQRGLIGLFRGLEAKLLQTVLTAALMFATYEKIVRFVFSLLRRNQKMLLKH